MKRFASFWFSIIILCCSLFPALSVRVSAGSYNGFYYTNRYGELAITGYYGSDPYPSIPSEIDGKPVAFIEDAAFQYNRTIKGMTIPNTVWGIGIAAFEQCVNLSVITLPESVCYVGWAAFARCTSLREVNYRPKNVGGINAQAFEDCTALEKVTFANGAEGDFNGGTFKGCKSLKSISLPKNITSISPSLFEGCTSLEAPSLPKGISYICDKAFSGCTFKSIELPEGLLGIGAEAFKDCTLLKKINIPKSVVSIGKDALYNTALYRSLTWSNGLLYYDNYLLKANSEHGKSVSVKAGTLLIADGVFENDTRLERIVVCDSVKRTGRSAFSGCVNLKDVVLPYGLESIDVEAFSGCINLKEVDLPGGLVSIGWDAFSDCSSLQAVAIPKNVREIDSNAFAGCTSLKEITIPIGVERLGETVFQNSGIRDIYCEINEEPRGWSYHWDSVITGYDYSVDDYGVHPPIYEKIGAKIHWGEKQIDIKACALKELTAVDFLAFSILAYETEDTDIKSTVYSLLGSKGLLKPESKYGKTEYSFSEICSGIYGWYVSDVKETNMESGFTGIAFCNGNGEYVIAYEGSNGDYGPLSFNDRNSFNDWYMNDFPMYMGRLTAQMPQAMDFYLKILSEAKKHSDNAVQSIAVTGHSLGGGLADAVSCFSGSYGETFNAAPFINVAYSTMPEFMAPNFHGVDRWNYYDHVNEADIFVGGWNYYEKNCIIHKNDGYNEGGLFGPHKLSSFFAARGADGKVTLTDSVQVKATLNIGRKQTPLQTPLQPAKKIADFLKAITPISGAIINMYHDNGDLYLGNCGNDSIAAPYNTKRIFFGGDGDDLLDGSAAGSSVFVGGEGKDVLIGSKNNDIYLISKDDLTEGDSVRVGSYCDTISDRGGIDGIYLYGFAASDSINVTEDDKFVYVNLNGTPIAKVVKYNRGDKLIIKAFDYHFKELFSAIEVTNPFLRLFGMHFKFACPIDVRIKDQQGRVVYKVPDFPGIYTEDFGVFTVYEENGETVREFELAEGYCPVISGTGDGTMNVYFEDNTGGADTTFGSTDIAVTRDFSAEINIEDPNNAVLNIDHDSNGKFDTSVKLVSVRATVTVTADNPQFASEYETIETVIGDSIRISAYVDPLAEFLGWYENDVFISNELTLIYNVKGDARIKAVYGDSPSAPVTPSSPLLPGGTASSGMVIGIVFGSLIAVLTAVFAALVLKKAKNARE